MVTTGVRVGQKGCSYLHKVENITVYVNWLEAKGKLSTNASSLATESNFSLIGDAIGAIVRAPTPW